MSAIDDRSQRGSGQDSELDRAWREHSQEMPPSAADRAILAAARRAVGSRPLDAANTIAEATRPPKLRS